MTTNTHRTNVNLTVKKMVENYLESCCDEKVWDAFYTMYKYDVLLMKCGLLFMISATHTGTVPKIM